MKKNLRSEIFRYIFIVIGSISAALGINLFLAPNLVVSGGVGGIGIVLNAQYGIPVGITMLVLNIPLFILGVWYLGRSFGIKTVFATLVLSISIDIFSFLPAVTDNTLLAALFGGILMGSGLGLVFRQGATSGGTDLGAKLLHKLIPFISIGQFLLIIDFTVIFTSALIFRQPDLSLYGMVSLMVISRLIDLVIEGVDSAIATFVISEKYEEISQEILKQGRGVTALQGTGMFTGNDRRLLVCVMRVRQLPRIKIMIQNIDKDAFVFVADVKEVLGEGFSAPR
jgi:uncharacterized membrane-anchored protein YitT (DUF2179 family)